MATCRDFYDLAKNWADSGNGFIEVPEFGYQCIGLIVGLNNALGAGLQPVIVDGSGRARCFYVQYAEGWTSLPAGWHTVAGNPHNDEESIAIYNSLPNGAICCWDTVGEYAYYGHVTIKAGDWGTDTDSIEQNGARQWEPAHYANMGRLCAGGYAGFLGAVVSDDSGWGTPSGGGGGEEQPQPQNPSQPSWEAKPPQQTKLDLQKTLDSLLSSIKDIFNQNVYRASEQYMFNKVIKLTKNMNLWRVELSDEALDQVKNAVQDALKTVIKDSQPSQADKVPQGAPTQTHTPSAPQDESVMSDEDKVRYITQMCRANCGNANAYGIAGLVGNFVGESNLDPFTFEAKAYWVDAGEDWRNDPTVETLFGSWASFVGLYGIPLREEIYRGSDGRHYCGLGLGQWTGGRAEGLANYARQSGKGWYSLQAQMEYAFNEGGMTETLKKCLVNSESIHEGVDNVYTYWEGASVSSSLPTRYAGAEQWYPFIRDLIGG